MCAHRGGHWCERWCYRAKPGWTIGVSGVTPWDSSQLQGAAGRCVCLYLLPIAHLAPYPRSTGVFVRPGAFPHPPPLFDLSLFSQGFLLLLQCQCLHTTISHFLYPAFIPLFLTIINADICIFLPGCLHVIISTLHLSAAEVWKPLQPCKSSLADLLQCHSIFTLRHDAAVTHSCL